MFNIVDEEQKFDFAYVDHDDNLQTRCPIIIKMINIYEPLCRVLLRTRDLHAYTYIYIYIYIYTICI